MINDHESKSPSVDPKILTLADRVSLIVSGTLSSLAALAIPTIVGFVVDRYLLGDGAWCSAIGLIVGMMLCCALLIYYAQRFTPIAKRSGALEQLDDDTPDGSRETDPQ